MQTIQHPEEGQIDRYSVVHRPESVIITENDENGVVSEVEIDRTSLDDVVHQLHDVVDIAYEIHQDDLHSRGVVTLPSWCEGSPREAIALHFFGYVVGIVHAVTRAEVVAQPIIKPEDSDDFPAPGPWGCDDD